MKTFTKLLPILQSIQQKVVEQFPDATCCVDYRTFSDKSKIMEFYYNLGEIHGVNLFYDNWDNAKVESELDELENRIFV